MGKWSHIVELFRTFYGVLDELHDPDQIQGSEKYWNYRVHV